MVGPLPPDQLDEVGSRLGYSSAPTLQDGNAQGFLKLRQGGVSWDLQSADALWVPKMNEGGLTSSFDIADVSASKELFSVARALPFWADGSLTMAYPFGWSTVQIYADLAAAPIAPDSWDFLVDKRFVGSVVTDSQPTDLMALAGIATGAASPYAMTQAELHDAKSFLAAAKPAFVKVVSQIDELVRTTADGAAVVAIGNLGTDYRVRDAGGPQLTPITPREGVFGFIDGEQLVSASGRKEDALRFLGAMERDNWIADNFLANGRPLFNEGAYKLLVDRGEEERANRLYYNQPERALEMVLKAPAADEQAYTDAYNEVFGA